MSILATAGAVTMTRGTAAGMEVGTVAGTIRGSTVLPAIGATARPLASAGVGAVSMPATGVRPGAGVATGDPVIGAVATGVVTGDIITITTDRAIIAMIREDALRMQAATEETAEEVEALQLTAPVHAIAIMDLLLL